MATSSGIGRAVWLASGGFGLALAGFVAGRLSMSSARLEASAKLGSQQQSDETMPLLAAPATIESDDLVLAGVVRDEVVAPPTVEPAAVEPPATTELDAAAIAQREEALRSAAIGSAELAIPNPIADQLGSATPSGAPQLTAGETAAIEAAVDEYRSQWVDVHIKYMQLVEELLAEKLKNARPVAADDLGADRDPSQGARELIASRTVVNGDETYSLELRRGESAMFDELVDRQARIRRDASRRLSDLLASFDR